jgi:hypothetical protein
MCRRYYWRLASVGASCFVVLVAWQLGGNQSINSHTPKHSLLLRLDGRCSATDSNAFFSVSSYGAPCGNVVIALMLASRGSKVAYNIKSYY